MRDVLLAIRRQRLHEPGRWLERAVVWGGAAAVGLVTVLFARLSETLSHGFQLLQMQAHWIPLVLTPLGGMLLVYTLRRWFAGAEGSGIPQTIAALQAEDRQIGIGRFLSVRIALAKVSLGSLALGAGFSMGREGPSVQVGASLMYALRRFLPAGHDVVPNHLILAGGAAGIAAAFNTPLAGIVFAIEELSRKFEHKTNGLLLSAIVLAGMVSISMQGNYLYFGHFQAPGIDSAIIVPVLVCGGVCGMAGGLFSRALLWSARPWAGAAGRWRARHPVWFAGLCGLGVALIGLATQGATHGSGYEATRQMLASPDAVGWHFAPAKLLATLLSYFSGAPGGIFAPSLAVGAGIGHDLLPLLGQSVPSAGIYALCMAAFLGAVTQAPITAFIIVMEMIDGHEMVLSLMAATLIASLVSRLFSPALYHTLALRQLDRAADGAGQKKTAPEGAV
ncbi:chloride channel protein [Chitinimonas koreensis]|uniref:chloride channel protein n=1 Tax=Chitinimonas koreensis TaxID=356302 RepID=UPI000410B642|nr:chloride channel protein [Chitinimonas koreensis]QNM98697.1 chloride channel protein [Chitinimonas koreensis]